MEGLIKRYKEDPLFKARESVQRELDKHCNNNIGAVTVDNGDGSYSINLVVEGEKR